MPKTALMFPGQGSQYPGMGKVFYEKYPVVQKVFEEACDTLGFDIKKLCFEADVDELTQTKNAQPAIYTVSVAMFQAYMEEYDRPPYCLAGHSLGEISALSCSGAISFRDGLHIVKRRGELMQEAASFGLGGMTAVSGMEHQAVEQMISDLIDPDSIVNISCYNSANQLVISGNRKGIMEMEKALKEKGAEVTPLKVSAPFHNILMGAVADRLEKELQKYEYHSMQYPVINNIDAKPYQSSEEIIQKLKMQIVHPVLWIDIMNELEKEDIQVAIEVGPKHVLKNLLKRSKEAIKVFALDKKEDKQQLDKIWLPANRPKMLKDFIRRCLSISLCTKNGNYDEQAYYQGVVLPVKNMRQLLSILEEEQREPQPEEMSRALELMMTVLSAKGVSTEEQKQRLELLRREADHPDVQIKIDSVQSRILVEREESHAGF
ncbi:ACP S-malonyltransferase [Brevibacillus sp. SYSU BS000544]|uniref:ACP S-malonyltransferase n=1 Tax=Brevibacillus sp. SYSU BS000544 TaxID=3416443 RepID=UPI003CE46025